MAGFSRNIKITALDGWLTCDAKLTSVKEPEDRSLLSLCTGEGAHDAEKPCWDPVCPTCGPVERTTLIKGKEVAEDQYAVLAAGEIDAIKADDEQYKGRITLTAHDAAEVDAKVVPSGTSYYCEPGKGDAAWYKLAMVLDATPDLIWLGIYTINTRAALYRVRPYGNALIFDQMLRPEEVKAAPEVTRPEVPVEIAEMGATLARASVKPFDPVAYRNTVAERLATAVRDAEAAGTTTILANIKPNVTAQAVDPIEAMRAEFAAAMAAKGIGNGSAASTDGQAKPKRTRKPKAVAS